MSVNKETLAKMIDHTVLKPYATSGEVIQFCQEAKDFGFFSVCVPPFFVPIAKKILEGTPIKITTVIGFPLGYASMQTKAFEAKEACTNGADELDMVMNIAAFKDNDDSTVLEDIHNVVKVGLPTKVIIETCLLGEEEKVKACGLVEATGAQFIKTSTGFSHKGADLKDIQLIKKQLQGSIQIKASGGISNASLALQFIAAGASRLGTSSGVCIMKEFQQLQQSSSSYAPPPYDFIPPLIQKAEA